MRQWLRGSVGSPPSGAGIPRPPVHRITLAQVGVLTLLCLIVLAVSAVDAFSLLCGGLVAIVPQAYFAAVTFRQRGAGAAQAIVRSSYIGEVGKFLLSMAGFAIVFVAVRPINGAAVFGGYAAMLGVHIFGGWWLLRRPPEVDRNVDSNKSVD
mgnify:CR=1 FL=1